MQRNRSVLTTHATSGGRENRQGGGDASNSLGYTWLQPELLLVKGGDFVDMGLISCCCIGAMAVGERRVSQQSMGWVCDWL